MKFGKEEIFLLWVLEAEKGEWIIHWEWLLKKDMRDILDRKMHVLSDAIITINIIQTYIPDSFKVSGSECVPLLFLNKLTKYTIITLTIIYAKIIISSKVDL